MPASMFFRGGEMGNYRKRAAERYEKMLAVTQADLPGGRKAAMRYYARNLLPHLPGDRDSTILDLGCGTGLFLEFLMRTGFSEARGLDICEEHIRACCDRGLDAELGDNLAYLGNNRGRFDCVAMNHVLEHYDKDEGLKLLEAVLESLRPGGRLIAVCPNMANPLTAGRGRYADLTHETGYTEESIGFMMQLAGFEEVSVRGIDIYCLSNPLANLAGKAVWAVMSSVWRIAYLVNGVRSTTVLTKNMLAVSERPAK